LFGDTIGHGLLAFPTLRQGADLAGAAGLTFVLIAVNQCAYEALRLRRQDRRRALAAAALACVLIASLSVYGRLRIGQVAAATPASAPLTAALVQADLGDYEALRARLGTFDAVAEILERHEALSNEALSDEAFSNEALSNETVSNEAPSREARSGDAPSRHALEPSAGGTPAVDLLVWPETVYPTTFAKPKSADGAAFDRRIVEFTEHTHVPLLFGTYDRDGDREYNAAVLLQPDAQRSEQRYAVYRKKRLFPLTEELPAWLDRPFVRARLPWLGSWHGGDGRSTLTLQRRGGAALRIAPLVCLDAVDPGLAIDAARAGADLLVAMSNDGWFAGSRGARLHLIVSAFRSIETRLPQLRATNTGISAAISPTGEILARTALSKPAVLTASVQPGRRGSTLMLRWGDWFPPGAAAIALALVLSALTRRRRPAA
jgi:apolipoprotein N-acyltransferase